MKRKPLSYSCFLSKSAAIFLLICFTVNSIGEAAPFVPSEIPHSPWVEQLQIPEALGRIDEKYFPPQNLDQIDFPTLVHIQDAHSSYDAQKKIEALLRYLRENYGFNLVLAEGAEGPLDPAPLEAEMAEPLAKEGAIGGVELDLLSSKRTSPAFGVERDSDYWKNFLDFRKALAGRPEADEFLKKIKSELGREASRHFNPALRQFMKEVLFYEDSQQELLRHLSELQKAAHRELNLDLADAVNQREWPELVRYFKMKEIEKKIDAPKAKAEKEKLIEWLKAKKLEDIGSQAMTRQSIERFYQAAKPLGFRFKDYPAYSNELALQILGKEIEGKSLFLEIEKAKDLILEKLAVSAKEKELIQGFKDYLLLKRLFALELTRKEYEVISTTVGRRNPEMTDSILSLFNHAVRFYEGALKRDETMAANAFRKMKEQKQDRAVIVTGGFHSEGIREKLKERGAAYAVISPTILETGDAKKYLDLMTARPASAGPEKSKIKSPLYLAPVLDSKTLQAETAELSRALQTTPSGLSSIHPENLQDETLAARLLKFQTGLIHREKIHSLRSELRMESGQRKAILDTIERKVIEARTNEGITKPVIITEKDLEDVVDGLGSTSEEIRSSALKLLPELPKELFTEPVLELAMDVFKDPNAKIQAAVLRAFKIFLDKNASLASEPLYSLALSDPGASHEKQLAGFELIPVLLEANSSLAVESHLKYVLDFLASETNKVHASFHAAEKTLPVFLKENAGAFTPGLFKTFFDSVDEHDGENLARALRVIRFFVQADPGHAEDQKLKKWILNSAKKSWWISKEVAIEALLKMIELGPKQKVEDIFDFFLEIIFAFESYEPSLADFEAQAKKAAKKLVLGSLPLFNSQHPEVFNEVLLEKVLDFLMKKESPGPYAILLPLFLENNPKSFSETNMKKLKTGFDKKRFLYFKLLPYFLKADENYVDESNLKLILPGLWSENAPVEAAALEAFLYFLKLKPAFIASMGPRAQKVLRDAEFNPAFIFVSEKDLEELKKRLQPEQNKEPLSPAPAAQDPEEKDLQPLPGVEAPADLFKLPEIWLGHNFPKLAETLAAVSKRHFADFMQDRIQIYRQDVSQAVFLSDFYAQFPADKSKARDAFVFVDLVHALVKSSLERMQAGPADFNLKLTAFIAAAAAYQRLDSEAKKALKEITQGKNAKAFAFMERVDLSGVFERNHYEPAALFFADHEGVKLTESGYDPLKTAALIWKLYPVMGLSGGMKEAAAILERHAWTDRNGKTYRVQLQPGREFGSHTIEYLLEKPHQRTFFIAMNPVDFLRAFIPEVSPEDQAYLEVKAKAFHEELQKLAATGRRSEMRSVDFLGANLTPVDEQPLPGDPVPAELLKDAEQMLKKGYPHLYPYYDAIQRKHFADFLNAGASLSVIHGESVLLLDKRYADLLKALASTVQKPFKAEEVYERLLVLHFVYLLSEAALRRGEAAEPDFNRSLAAFIAQLITYKQTHLISLLQSSAAVMDTFFQPETDPAAGRSYTAVLEWMKNQDPHAVLDRAEYGPAADFIAAYPGMDRKEFDPAKTKAYLEQLYPLLGIFPGNSEVSDFVNQRKWRGISGVEMKVGIEYNHTYHKKENKTDLKFGSYGFYFGRPGGGSTSYTEYASNPVELILKIAKGIKREGQSYMAQNYSDGKLSEADQKALDDKIAEFEKRMGIEPEKTAPVPAPAAPKSEVEKRHGILVQQLAAGNKAAVGDFLKRSRRDQKGLDLLLLLQQKGREVSDQTELDANDYGIIFDSQELHDWDFGDELRDRWGVDPLPHSRKVLILATAKEIEEKKKELEEKRKYRDFLKEAAGSNGFDKAFMQQMLIEYDQLLIEDRPAALEQWRDFFDNDSAYHWFRTNFLSRSEARAAAGLGAKRTSVDVPHPLPGSEVPSVVLAAAELLLKTHRPDLKAYYDKIKRKHFGASESMQSALEIIHMGGENVLFLDDKIFSQPVRENGALVYLMLVYELTRFTLREAPDEALSFNYELIALAAQTEAYHRSRMAQTIRDILSSLDLAESADPASHRFIPVIKFMDSIKPDLHFLEPPNRQAFVDFLAQYPGMDKDQFDLSALMKHVRMKELVEKLSEDNPIEKVFKPVIVELLSPSLTPERQAEILHPDNIANLVKEVKRQKTLMRWSLDAFETMVVKFHPFAQQKVLPLPLIELAKAMMANEELNDRFERTVKVLIRGWEKDSRSEVRSVPTAGLGAKLKAINEDDFPQPVLKEAVPNKFLEEPLDQLSDYFPQLFERFEKIKRRHFADFDTLQGSLQILKMGGEDILLLEDRYADLFSPGVFESDRENLLYLQLVQELTKLVLSEAAPAAPGDFNLELVSLMVTAQAWQHMAAVNQPQPFMGGKWDARDKDLTAPRFKPVLEFMRQFYPIETYVDAFAPEHRQKFVDFIAAYPGFDPSHYDPAKTEAFIALLKEQAEARKQSSEAEPQLEEIVSINNFEIDDEPAVLKAKGLEEAIKNLPTPPFEAEEPFNGRTSKNLVKNSGKQISFWFGGPSSEIGWHITFFYAGGKYEIFWADQKLGIDMGWFGRNDKRYPIRVNAPKDPFFDIVYDEVNERLKLILTDEIFGELPGKLAGGWEEGVPGEKLIVEFIPESKWKAAQSRSEVRTAQEIEQQVLAYYTAKEQLIEAYKKQDAEAYRRAFQVMETSAKEASSAPRDELERAFTAVLNSGKIKKEFMGEAAEMFLAAGPLLNEEHLKIIREVAREVAEAVTTGSHVEELEKDLISRTREMRLADIITPDIQTQPMTPEVMIQQLEMMSRPDSGRFWGLQWSSMIEGEESRILLRPLEDLIAFRVAHLHEIVHNLAHQGYLPILVNHELITHATTAFELVRAKDLQGLRDFGGDLYTKLFERGQEIFREGKSADDTQMLHQETAKIEDEFLKATMPLDKLTKLLEPKILTPEEQTLQAFNFERLTGTLLGGYAWEREKTTEQKGLAYLFDYAVNVLAREDLAFARWRTNPENERRINRLRRSLESFARILTNQASLEIVDWKKELTGSDVPEVRYFDNPPNSTIAVPPAVWMLDEKVAKGLIAQEIHRANYSQPKFIEDEFKENETFMDLWRTVETARVVEAAKSDHPGAHRWIEKYYEYRNRIVPNLPMVQQKMAGFPLHLQYLAGLLWEWSQKGPEARDPRITDERVQKALEETRKPFRESIASKSQKHYEITRDHLWRVMKQLREEAIQNAMKEGNKSKADAEKEVDGKEKSFDQQMGGQGLAELIKHLMQEANQSQGQGGQPSGADQLFPPPQGMPDSSGQGQPGPAKGAQGQGQGLAQAMEALIEEAAELEKLAQQAQQTAKELRETAGKFHDKDEALKLAEQLDQLAQQLHEEAGSLNAQAKEFQKQAGEAANKKEASSQGMEELSKQAGDLLEKTEKLKQDAGGLEQQTQRVVERAKNDPKNVTPDIAAGLQQYTDQLKKQTGEINERARRLNELTKALRQGKNPAAFEPKKLEKLPEPAKKEEKQRPVEEIVKSGTPVSRDELAKAVETLKKIPPPEKKKTEPKKEKAVPPHVEHYKAKKAVYQAKISTIDGMIKRELQKTRKRRVRGGLPDGDFVHDGSIANIKMRPPAIMGRRSRPGKFNHWFSLLTDVSGSMQPKEGRPIEEGHIYYASIAAMILRESTRGKRGIQVEEYAFGSGIHRLRDYKDRLTDDLAAQIDSSILKIDQGSTDDIGAISGAIERLKKQRQNYPGLRIFGIGVGPGTEKVKEAYAPYGYHVLNADEIPKLMTQIVQRELGLKGQDTVPNVIIVITDGNPGAANAAAIQKMGADNKEKWAKDPARSEVRSDNPIKYVTRIIDGKKVEFLEINGQSMETGPGGDLTPHVEIVPVEDLDLPVPAGQNPVDEVPAKFVARLELNHGSSRHEILIPLSAYNLGKLSEMMEVLTSRIKPNLYLRGPAGTAKNTLLYLLAAFAKRPAYLMSLHFNTTREELIAMQTYEEKNNKGSTRYQISPVVQAADDPRGAWGVVDEVNKPEQEGVLAALHPLLDPGRSIRTPDSKLYVAAKDFRIIAMGNSSDEKMYEVSETPEDFNRRFNFVEMTPLHSPRLDGETEDQEKERLKELEFLLRLQAPILYAADFYFFKQLVLFAQDTYSAYQQDQLPRPLTIRGMIRIVKHMQRFPEDITDFWNVLGSSYNLQRLTDLEKQELERLLANRLPAYAVKNTKVPVLKSLTGPMNGSKNLFYQILDQNNKPLAWIPLPEHPETLLPEKRHHEHQTVLRHKLALMKAIMLGEHILVYGHTGTGKTSIAKDLLVNDLKRKFFQVGLDAQSTTKALWGGQAVKDNNVGWEDSPTLASMDDGTGVGHANIVDDLGKPEDQAVVSIINNILQFGEIMTPYGLRAAKPGFFMLATTTPVESIYRVFELSGEVEDRFYLAYFDYMSEEEEKSELERQYPKIPKAFIARFVGAMRELRTEHKNGNMERPVTTEDMIAALDRFQRSQRTLYEVFLSVFGIKKKEYAALVEGIFKKSEYDLIEVRYRDLKAPPTPDEILDEKDSHERKNLIAQLVRSFHGPSGKTKFKVAVAEKAGPAKDITFIHDSKNNHYDITVPFGHGPVTFTDFLQGRAEFSDDERNTLKEILTRLTTPPVSPNTGIRYLDISLANLIKLRVGPGNDGFNVNMNIDGLEKDLFTNKKMPAEGAPLENLRTLLEWLSQYELTTENVRKKSADILKRLAAPKSEMRSLLGLRQGEDFSSMPLPNGRSVNPLLLSHAKRVLKDFSPSLVELIPEFAEGQTQYAAEMPGYAVIMDYQGAPVLLLDEYLEFFDASPSSQGDIRITALLLADAAVRYRLHKNLPPAEGLNLTEEAAIFSAVLQPFWNHFAEKGWTFTLKARARDIDDQPKGARRIEALFNALDHYRGMKDEKAKWERFAKKLKADYPVFKGREFHWERFLQLRRQIARLKKDGRIEDIEAKIKPLLQSIAASIDAIELMKKEKPGDSFKNVARDLEKELSDEISRLRKVLEKASFISTDLERVLRQLTKDEEIIRLVFPRSETRTLIGLRQDEDFSTFPLPTGEAVDPDLLAKGKGFLAEWMPALAADLPEFSQTSYAAYLPGYASIVDHEKKAVLWMDENMKFLLPVPRGVDEFRYRDSLAFLYALFLADADLHYRFGSGLHEEMAYLMEIHAPFWRKMMLPALSAKAILQIDQNKSERSEHLESFLDRLSRFSHRTDELQTWQALAKELASYKVFQNQTFDPAKFLEARKKISDYFREQRSFEEIFTAVPDWELQAEKSQKRNLKFLLERDFAFGKAFVEKDDMGAMDAVHVNAQGFSNTILIGKTKTVFEYRLVTTMPEIDTKPYSKILVEMEGDHLINVIFKETPQKEVVMIVSDALYEKITQADYTNLPFKEEKMKKEEYRWVGVSDETAVPFRIVSASDYFKKTKAPRSEMRFSPQELTAEVARELLYQILDRGLVKSLTDAEYRRLLGFVMPEKQKGADLQSALLQAVSEKDKQILASHGVLNAQDKDGLFGLSVVPAAHYEEADLLLAKTVLASYPNKFQVVIVKHITDRRLEELNQMSDEMVQGRVLLIREGEQGYGKTVDSLFRGDRKVMPVLPKFLGIASKLASEAGLGRVTKLQDLLQSASVVFPQSAGENFPYFELIKARLLDQHVRIRQKLNFESALSIVTAGLPRLDSMHLSAELLRNLREVSQVGENITAKLDPSEDFINSLSNLRAAAEKLMSAA